ncbi:hypothetical protein KM908_13920 [Alkalihalobacillus clausii]|uniref:hypothetical protein n=1 Tax=Shouchella clausii TaxID=79880 RepID=UPI001C247911|nr:hypothetical protein [Shouchella clausii]MBU8597239.1 hypothetical protein [Shouchella clausii]
MRRFVVRYHFDKEHSVSEEIQAESTEDAWALVNKNTSGVHEFDQSDRTRVQVNLDKVRYIKLYG